MGGDGGWWVVGVVVHVHDRICSGWWWCWVGGMSGDCDWWWWVLVPDMVSFRIFGPLNPEMASFRPFGAPAAAPPDMVFFELLPPPSRSGRNTSKILIKKLR